MNLKELKELIELVSEKGFAEFEIERQGFRLKISRFKDQSNSNAAAVPPLVIASPLPLELAPGTAQIDARIAAAAAAAEPAPDMSEASAHAAAPSEPIQLHIIKSPIVGTFFRAPSPNSMPFVRAGDRVEPETVVCIIEAMKLMNEIQAEIAGTVMEIYVENGLPVEYGQPLFGIKT